MNTIQKTILQRRRQVTTKTGFKGNLTLRAENEVIHYTPEQIMEYAKCADPVHGPTYFIENYIKIVHADYGIIPFKLYPYQKRIIDTCHNNRFVISKIGRQMGKTSTIVAYVLWYILFNEDKSVGIVGNKLDAAKEDMSRLQKAYEQLPKWLQQGVREWNKTSIELANGCKVYAAATSASGIRGKTLNLIVLDEFAHVQQHIAREFFESTYPVISSGETTKVFIISTPKGMNMFWSMWIDAEKGKNSYKTVTCHWSEYPGHDAAWAKETVENLGGQEAFDQEYGVEFLGSAGTLISSAKIKKMKEEEEYPKEIGENGKLRIYNIPEEGHTYTMSCDVSHGQGLDAQAFSVIDVTNIPWKVVASFADPNLSPLIYPNVIYRTAKWYNDAFVLVEINDIGQMIALNLHNELEYDNLIKLQTKGKMGQRVSGGYSKGVQYGVRTTTPVKRQGCVNLKTLIERDKLLVTDGPTIAEFTSFIVTKESYAAEEGLHDDLVMSLVLFGWLSDQAFFKSAANSDIRTNLLKEIDSQRDSDFIPIGLVDKGLSIYDPNQGDGWVLSETINY